MEPRSIACARIRNIAEQGLNDSCAFDEPPDSAPPLPPVLPASSTLVF